MARLTRLALWLCLILPACGWAQSGLLAPLPSPDWWPIAGVPGLGRYNSPGQQPVDFCVWQAADGSWQLWSCIRNTACPGNGRLLFGWEAPRLTSRDWRPMGIKMTSEPRLGEAEGGLQAPHVVRLEDGRFIMAYGDWNRICFAQSRDGKTFQRILRADGTPAAFSEGERSNTRDPMLIRINGVWHCYYTAILGEKGYIFCRQSPDLKSWGPACVVNYGGKAGTGPWWSECPFVVEPRPGEFVLFRNQFYGAGQLNWQYASRNPLYFGIDDDHGLTGSLPIGAPEVIRDGQDWYLAYLNPGLDGIRMTRLRWGRLPRAGRPVFDFDSPQGRAGWRQLSGTLPQIFTDVTFAPLRGPARHVIGTSETGRGQFNDAFTAVIESPVFTLTEPEYVAFVSGGADRAKTFVALTDARDGSELARWSGARGNELAPAPLDARALKGRRARLRIVDQSGEAWGHINFGGLYAAPKPQPIP